MDRMSAEEYKNMIHKQEKSKNKYNNKKIDVDGIMFDSIKEANRYSELKLLLRSGIIKNLLRQVRFELIPKNKFERSMYYILDFVYEESGQTIAEDVKGMKTQVYINKRKLFKQRYPDILFKET